MLFISVQKSLAGMAVDRPLKFLSVKMVAPRPSAAACDMLVSWVEAKFGEVVFVTYGRYSSDKRAQES